MPLIMVICNVKECALHLGFPARLLEMTRLPSIPLSVILLLSVLAVDILLLLSHVLVFKRARIAFSRCALQRSHGSVRVVGDWWIVLVVVGIGRHWCFDLARVRAYSGV
jgi:hypothetical protein